MVIYDFDSDFRIEMLRKNFNYVKELKNSLTDNRYKFRDFAMEINILPESLLTGCDMFERTLLIDSYTFAEQLLKNFYYELIEKDRHNNLYLRKFVNMKIPNGKFSPNVEFQQMEKAIKNELVDGFKFIISKDKDEIKSYNEMINARHTYAHSGNYSFDFNKFEEVLDVLEYINFELSMIIANDGDFRLNFQNKYTDILDLCKSIKRKKNKINVYNKQNIISDLRNELKDSKKKCNQFSKKYLHIIQDVTLIIDKFEQIKQIGESDLRNVDNFLEKIDSFQCLV